MSDFDDADFYDAAGADWITHKTIGDAIEQFLCDWTEATPPECIVVTAYNRVKFNASRYAQQMAESFVEQLEDEDWDGDHDKPTKGLNIDALAGDIAAVLRKFEPQIKLSELKTVGIREYRYDGRGNPFSANNWEPVPTDTKEGEG